MTCDKPIKKLNSLQIGGEEVHKLHGSPQSASSYEVQWGQSTTAPIGSPTTIVSARSIQPYLLGTKQPHILLELEAYAVPEMYRNGLNMLPLRQIGGAFLSSLE